MDIIKLLSDNLAGAQMGPGLHWFPADVPAARLALVMVGMANGDGGVVLIGVSPRSGRVQGVPDLAATLDVVFQAALLVDPSLVLPMPRQHRVEIGAELVEFVAAGRRRGLRQAFAQVAGHAEGFEQGDALIGQAEGAGQVVMLGQPNSKE